MGSIDDPQPSGYVDERVIDNYTPVHSCDIGTVDDQSPLDPDVVCIDIGVDVDDQGLPLGDMDDPLGDHIIGGEGDHSEEQYCDG